MHYVIVRIGKGGGGGAGHPPPHTPPTPPSLVPRPNASQLRVDYITATLDTTLDRLGNHTATCTRGGDVVSCQNHLRDLVLEFCRRAHQVVRVEKGSGLTPDHSRTRPADILV